VYKSEIFSTLRDLNKKIVAFFIVISCLYVHFI